MSKRTTGFYLEEQNIKWLEAEGKQQDRSSSYYLDKLLTDLRERNANKQNAQEKE